MSKLSRILFGRRTWAIVVSLIMVLQLLPLATIADNAEGSADAVDVVAVDRSGIEIGVDEVGLQTDGRGDEGDFNPGALIGDLPDNPTDPENPEEPENPADPENPEEPEDPADPENTEEPEDPADPENTEDPGDKPEFELYIPVTFVDKDGKVLVVKSVLAGTAIGELPEAPAVEGRAFIGWYTELGQHVYSTTVVKGIMRVIARYEGDEVGMDELPAQTFSAVTPKNVTVNASVPEGVFPAGTTMRVTDLKEDETHALALTMVSESELADAVAVDISFYDANGYKIEPKQNSVHVEIDAGRKLEGEVFKLYHEVSDGVLSMMGYATPYGASFESSSFSVYIVIGTQGEKEYARITVNFHRMKADGTNETTSEAVSILVKPKDHDTTAMFEKVVYDPGPGTLPSGFLFAGWSKTASWNASTSGLTFAQVREDIWSVLSRNKDDDTTNDFVDLGITLDYYAMAFASVTVTYKDQNGASIKTDVVRLTNGSASYTVSTSYTPELMTQSFEGWTTSVPSTSDGETYTYTPAVTSANLYKVGEESGTFTVTQNVVLYPYIKTGYWLMFDNNINQDTDPTKGAYIGPIFYGSDEVTNESDITPSPSRPGYTFGGWYTTAAMTTAFTFGSTLTQDTTIYAKWTADTTTISVVFWTQKATDAVNATDAEKTYEFYGSITFSGTTGATYPMQS